MMAVWHRTLAHHEKIPAWSSLRVNHSNPYLIVFHVFQRDSGMSGLEGATWRTPKSKHSHVVVKLLILKNQMWFNFTSAPFHRLQKSACTRKKLFTSVIQHFTQVNVLFNTESDVKVKSVCKTLTPGIHVEQRKMVKKYRVFHEINTYFSCTQTFGLMCRYKTDCLERFELSLNAVILCEDHQRSAGGTEPNTLKLWISELLYNPSSV